jgi:hypothetical protein
MLAGGRDIEEDMMRLIHAGHSPRSVILIRFRLSRQKEISHVA